MLLRLDSKKLTDEQLIQAYSKGSEQAFEELYSRYGRRLLYYFQRMLSGDQARAQDLLQDLFMKLAERPDRFNSEKKFSTWIFSIANNMCKNEYRKRGYATEFAEAELNEPTFVIPAEVIEVDLTSFRVSLSKALAELPLTYQQVFHLRHYEFLSLREISEVLDCPEGTVKSRLHNTLKLLAQKLSTFKDL